MITYYIAIGTDPHGKSVKLTDKFKLKEELLTYIIENFEKGVIFKIEQFYFIE